MLVATVAAGRIRAMHAAWPDQPERVVQTAALGAGLYIALSVAVYLAVARKRAIPGRAGLLVLAGVATTFAAFYLTWVSYYLDFPADILIWSEGDFVNDIVKFRIGYPLFTSQVVNDSFTYPPGSQFTTYAFAWLFGAPDSIPMYRRMQICFSVGSAAVAVCCYWRLRQLAGILHTPSAVLWGMFALPLFFLMATNSVTNPFSYNLHNDALAQFVAVLSYGLLLDYVSRRSKLTLVLMALVPAVGFFVKQSLGIWIPLYGLHLLFLDSPRSLGRVAGYAVGACAGMGLLLGGCFVAWGRPFWYWTVTAMSSKDVSPLRSFQHLLDAWPYYAAGLLAGFVLLRGVNASRLRGPWVIWLLFLLTETYTSGIEWLLNHMGPGCLIAGIWFLAALTRVWPDRLPAGARAPAVAWMRAACSVALVGLALAGFGLVWMPTNPLPSDANRYLEEIEREYVGLPHNQVLLDVGGDWIVGKEGIVLKDLAAGVGVRGSSRAGGDFSGILGRIRARYYKKILVHNLDAANFWYDDSSRWWREPSGIRQALRDHYQEVGKIKAVQGEKRFLLYPFEPLPFPPPRYGFQEITILVPRKG
jgi:hypothetical protein